VPRLDLLAYFYTPLVALGSHSAGGLMNAQISLSTLASSIVPDRQRLLTVCYRDNYTRDLIDESGTFIVNLLAAGQEGLLVELGMESGREGWKLRAEDWSRSALGNPVLRGGLGYLDCQVIDCLELGDATAFLGAVVEVEETGEGEPLDWQVVQKRLPREWLERYERKLAGDIERAALRARWL
jgi:flavin reductase (DIM6/NTAB) family NADH-FMN oxidoreductase RutF